MLRWRWFTAYQSKVDFRAPQILFSLLLFGVAASAQRPVADLPRIYVDTTWSEPAGEKIWAAHTVDDFVNSLAQSAPGDVIVLDAGGVYSGNFKIPAKSNPNKKWIYVISSAYSKLPPPGTRVSPADAANMPKIVTPGATNALRLADGANYWRFVGIEIYSASTYRPTSYTPGVFYGYALVDRFSYPGTSNIPDHIFFDRCYVHGDSTHDLQAGISGNSTNFAVVDSYISDIHMRGTDSQAINAYITPGPIKVVNNYLEAAGENVIFGGSGRGAFGFVPSDIEVQRNYFFKPLSWIPQSLNGTYVVKNLFELKSAQRVLFNNNILENNWIAGQVGAAFLLTIRTSQSGDIAVVEDVTVTNNIFKNVVMGFNTLAADPVCGTSSYPNCMNAGSSARWYIANNLITLYDSTLPGGGNGAHTGLIVFSGGRDVPKGSVDVLLHDLVLQHNTVVANSSRPCWQSIYFDSPQSLKPPFSHSATSNIWILDNVLCRQPTGGWGQQGTLGLTQYMGAPSAPPNDLSHRFYGNVMYVPIGDRVQQFPPHNLSTAKAFRYVDPSHGNYQLLEPRWMETSDEKPAGVDFASLPK